MVFLHRSRSSLPSARERTRMKSGSITPLRMRSESNNSSATTSFVSAAGYRPTYVDKTHVSGVDTVVLQIVNSSAPNPDHRAFYTSSFATVTEITDSNFTSLTHTGKMEFMDGYPFVLDRATNKIFNGSLNTISGWPSGNFIQKQITQDRSNGLAKWRNKMLAFADETVEVFENA